MNFNSNHTDTHAAQEIHTSARGPLRGTMARPRASSVSVFLVSVPRDRRMCWKRRQKLAIKLALGSHTQCLAGLSFSFVATNTQDFLYAPQPIKCSILRPCLTSISLCVRDAA